MMKKVFFTLVLLLSINIFSEAQSDMQTLFKKKGNNKNGYYFAPVFRFSKLDKEDALFFGIKGAWVISRSFGIGLSAFGLIPSIQKEGVLPNEKVRPLMGYGGFLAEPVIFSNKLVHATFPVTFGAGWAGYVKDWNEKLQNNEDELVSSQVFWVIEPGIDLELNVAKFFRVALGGSYRIMQDSSLKNTPPDALKGLNYSLTLKFGRF